MDKILFIINPKAGTDQNKALTVLIHKILGNSYEIYIEYTSYAGHAIQVAKEAVSKNFYAVVAVGGDGSVNEIAQSLVHSNTALGIIPKGSGNGLARSLHIDLDPSRALETIKNKKTAKIDSGLVNSTEYFFSNLGVGFDVAISKKFQNTNTRGLLGYTKIVVKELWKYKNKDYKITIDNQKPISINAFLLNVANAEQFGYNFKIAPDASLEDGIFDIIATQPFPKWKGLNLVFKAFNGKILSSKYVRKWHGKSITIESEDISFYQIDGDIKKNNNTFKLTIEILPKSLLVFQP